MLIGEFVLLVTVMVGIAAAARLILQSGLLNNFLPLATTGSWVTPSGTTCTNPTYTKIFYDNNCRGTSGYGYILGTGSCPTGPTGNCYAPSGNRISKTYLSYLVSNAYFCHVPASPLTSSSVYSTFITCTWKSAVAPTIRPTSTTLYATCAAGSSCLNTGMAECQVSKGIYKPCKNSSGGTGDCCYPTASGGGSSIGKSACYWDTATSTCKGSPPINCYVGTGGGDVCYHITSCTGRDPTNCNAVRTCNSDGVTDIDGKPCGSNAGGGPIGGGEPPPPPPGGGGPIGGGGFNDCGGDPNLECRQSCRAELPCPPEGCKSCSKPNFPNAVCCPLVAPPVEPPVEPPQPTEPPVPCSPSDDSDAGCRNKNIGQRCSSTDATLICENPNGILSNIDQMPVCNCGAPNGNNPPVQPGQFCSPNSPSAVCQNLKTGDVCDLATQNKCSGSPDANQEILCTCGASTNPTSIPKPSVTSGPTPTSDPTQVNWFAQGTGDLCTSGIYRTYFADTKCKPYSRIGYQTESLPNPIACNTDGSGECYKATGVKVTRKGINFTQSNDDTCKSASTEADQKPLIYRDQISPDGPIKCSFDLPPRGNITAQIKLQFDDKSDENIFEAKNRNLDSRDRIHQIGIFLADRTNESLYVVNKYFTKKDFNQGNLTKSFTFKSLFNDHEYEVFIRVIKNKKIIPFAYTINCPGQNTGTSCLLKPKDSVNVAFTVKIEKRLPEEIKGDKIADIYNQIIESYIGGKCDAKCISEKLKRLPESVGLQTATCDASLPGGCEFTTGDENLFK